MMEIVCFPSTWVEYGTEDLEDITIGESGWRAPAERSL
jgi:hypothetical protein